MPLVQPFTAPPPDGEVREVAEGILWARLRLPFRLDHVNVYFLRDDGGWMIVDAGLSDAPTREAWQRLLDDPLAGERFTGLVATHHHPDHIGSAGWLCERLSIPLLTSRTSFLTCLGMVNAPGILEDAHYTRFYARHGLPPHVASLVSTQGHEYLRMMWKPPAEYIRLADGEGIAIGGRTAHVMTADGHSPEQVMLNMPASGVFLAADQVIEKITPNVSIDPFEPLGNPLGAFLASLRRLVAEVDDDALVLSGHRLPFHGLHDRCAELAAHHDERCARIMDAAGAQPLTAGELVPVIFPRPMTAHEMSFAFSEVMAHINHLVAGGNLCWQDDPDGLSRVAWR